MAAARRPGAPIYMFNRYVEMRPLTGEPEPGEGWVKMECDSSKAYGCGENIQEAVKGLALYARLGEDPLITSSLAIRMTDEALRRFDKEFELVRPPRPDWLHINIPPTASRWVVAAGDDGVAHILMRAEDLMVIRLGLERPLYGGDLVYDHRRASLSIIKPVRVPALVPKPVPRRTCNGEYELFHLTGSCKGSD